MTKCPYCASDLRHKGSALISFECGSVFFDNTYGLAARSSKCEGFEKGNNWQRKYQDTANDLLIAKREVSELKEATARMALDLLRLGKDLEQARMERDRERATGKEVLKLVCDYLQFH